MEKIQFEPVGIIKNEFDEPADYNKIKEKPNTILIYDTWQGALLNIGECRYIDIIFFFHASEGYELSGKTSSDNHRGVFASRSPRRPNAIGVTTVKLLKHAGNTLLVEGLDAINNTPVLDIKCCDTSLFASESDSDPAHQAILKSDPRIEIRNTIRARKTDILLLRAGALHGHFCPGLAMGIMAATQAMNELQADSDGMEDLLAITETNNCFSDGVQFVTGCSFGNNALIFNDTGKTAFTLSKRDGHGIRICSRPESGDIIRQAFPDFQQLYRQVVEEQNHDTELVAAYKKSALDRAFGILDLPFEKLFTSYTIDITIPDYASIQESVVCSSCGESVMQSHTIEKEDKHYCYTCTGTKFPVLDGNGIHC